MPIDLPPPISRYYQSDLDNNPAFAECFTEDGVVVDEAKTYTGRQAIQEWKTGASRKFSYTVEPFSIEETNGKTIVTAHVVGNFPGSPVDLRYFFVLRDEKIASLEITL
jgi:hypothetical protein